MQDTRARFSKKNSKLGKIDNHSLLPIVDCPNHKQCENDCYAVKSLVQPSCKHAWTVNSWLANNDVIDYEQQMMAFFDKFPRRRYRLHVGGDFTSQAYLDMMIRVMSRYPKVRFLVYTKAFSLDYDKIPANCKLILSQWVGQTVPKHLTDRFTSAWYDDGTDDRIPENAHVCQGGAGKNDLHCDMCLKCWYTDLDIVFPDH